MEEAYRRFAAEMEKILRQCQDIRKDIVESQSEQDRLFREFDEHILPKIKTVDSGHGNR